MNLRQWAEREGLRYFRDDGSNEFDVIEMAYETVHCIGCGDMYVFRSCLTPLELTRMRRIGDPNTAERVPDGALEALTRASFEAPRYVLVTEEMAAELAAAMVKIMLKFRMAPLDSRLARGDCMRILLAAAVSIGRGIGHSDKDVIATLGEVLKEYGEPDPLTHQMMRVQ